MYRSLRPLFVSVLVFSGAVAAHAGSGVVAKQLDPADAIHAYWTPERMATAKPYDQGFDANNFNPNAIDLAPEPGPAVSVPGAGPEPGIKVRPRTLFDMADLRVPEILQPLSVGTGAGHFTSTQNFPAAADKVYPYYATGKLYFVQDGENFICSAAVIRPRVVLTAGHCVHKGSGGQNGFFSNFQFVPAQRGNTAPAGTWTVAIVYVTTTWYSGGGVVPNAADYAAFEINDRTISGSVKKIGAVTGYYGYSTLRLNQNHVTILGYPANFDSGVILHRVDTGFKKATSSNTAEYGSDMTGGSSGGPWLQNFGVLSSGQTDSSGTSRNQVVGVTSYGYTNGAIKLQGSSILDNRFTSLLTAVCNHRAGNC